MSDPLHKPFEALDEAVQRLSPGPKDNGSVELIVFRLPGEGRALPERALLSPDGGLHGDRWALHPDRNPGAQITLMNIGVAQVVAGSRERVPLTGDNLIVHLDLSEENLPAGTRLRIGEAVVEVTDVPHTGCQKFSRRFGEAALRLVNLKEYRERKLRGLYVRVLETGQVGVGDSIRKIG
jgi:hypothetical protein